MLSGGHSTIRPPETYSLGPAYQLTWDVDGAFPEDPDYPYGPHQQPRPSTFVDDVGGDCSCGSC